jgi:4-hydroxy-3-methylbut-2-enyl diphosphate reductase
MRITVDERSGFCTGVARAVEKAEKQLGNSGKLYSLGKIVHNTGEIDRLSGKGLKPLSYEEFKELKNATVLIRAHGEPPRIFEIAKENNITLIDATCPVVRRLQNRVKDAYTEMEKTGGQVLIFGKKDHPEVRALLGQTGGKAHVVRFPGDLDDMKLNQQVVLYSQTTMNQNEYNDFIIHLKNKIRDQGGDPDQFLKTHNSICKQVSYRESYLREFAAAHDAVLFVSGKESSNGKILFEICKEVNPDCYFVSNLDDIETLNLEGKESIGISGATSTPGWLIREVEKYLRSRMEF